MGKKFTLLLIMLGLLAASVAQGADSSLIGWWKLDEGVGAIAGDSSGKGNDGALQGDAAWVAEGYWGGAVFLDGDGDYVDCGTSDIYNVTDAVTVAAWVKADPDFSYPDWSGIIMRGGSPFDTFAIYYHAPSQRVGFKLTETSSEWHAVDAADLFDNDWHHVSGTYDGQMKAVYLDGEQLLSEGVTGQIQTSSGRLLLGAGRDLDPPTHYLVGVIDDARVFNRSLSQVEIQAVMLDAGETELAADPIPDDGATDVPRDVVLGWTPGEFAATHDMYFGTAFDDVNEANRSAPVDVLVVEGQAANAYDIGRLEFGGTYYWRIDEVNAAPDSAIYKGNVWSFTVEPIAYPIQNIVATSNAVPSVDAGPENTVNRSGLNSDDQHSINAADMWLTTTQADPVYIQYEFDRVYKLHEMLVWNYNVQFELVLGFGLKDVTISYSIDGMDWVVLSDAVLAQATARDDYTANTTVDLGQVTARYVRLTVNSGYGVMGQFGLSEVRFLYVPVQARAPQPADRQSDVAVDAMLSWRAGRQAAQHKIYLSTDQTAVTEGTALVDTVCDCAYEPGTLAFGSAYYWKVNEVNEAETVDVWAGDLWRFTTQEYAVIDDFESYNDDTNLIYETWLDGWMNETGSTVGYLEAPFAERTIVNNGRQSMPLQYDNRNAPFYSEAEYDLNGADWNGGGADTLRLYVHGQPDNDPATLYVVVEDTAGQEALVYHTDAQIALSTAWEEWLIPFDKLTGIDLGRVGTMYIGLGDRANPSVGGTGVIFADDIGVGHPISLE